MILVRIARKDLQKYWSQISFLILASTLQTASQESRQNGEF